jgi:hypothetical protein
MRGVADHIPRCLYAAPKIAQSPVPARVRTARSCQAEIHKGLQRVNARQHRMQPKGRASSYVLSIAVICYFSALRFQVLTTGPRLAPCVQSATTTALRAA